MILWPWTRTKRRREAEQADWELWAARCQWIRWTDKAPSTSPVYLMRREWTNLKFVQLGQETPTFDTRNLWWKPSHPFLCGATLIRVSLVPLPFAADVA